MTDYSAIAERFGRETASHTLAILHDEGLYRHLRFKAPGTSAYWFDLITVPGAMIFQGDGESYVFRRIDDMFEFFRGPYGGGINPSYWWEKVTSGRDSIMKYSQDLFEQLVKEHVAQDIRDGHAPRGIGRAITTLLRDGETWHEDAARRELDEFEHEDYRFEDTWDWSFRDYDWWYLWACHAIVWGIRQYDTAKATAEAVAS